MAESELDYGLLLQSALRGLVRGALEVAARPNGLPGGHHFFITFKTGASGVSMPSHLREEYPEEITIVLRTHYWDLVVEPDRFHVTLSFHGQKEQLTVPLAAISRFVDPVASFGLQLDAAGAETSPQAAAPPPPEPAEDGDAQVVSLDAFRKR